MPKASNGPSAEDVRTQLLLDITALVEFFEEHRVTWWPEKLHAYAAGIIRRDSHTIIDFAAHNRSGFAGLLDVWICPENTHAVTKAEEAAANARLDVLRSAVIQQVSQLEHLAYNIRDTESRWLCPVCGWRGDENGGAFTGENFNLYGGVVGSVICSCCLYQPGFDDDPQASASAQHTVTHSIDFYREAWFAAGKPWRGGGAPPADWNAHAQVANLFQVAPYLPRYSALVDKAFPSRPMAPPE